MTKIVETITKEKINWIGKMISDQNKIGIITKTTIEEIIIRIRMIGIEAEDMEIIIMIEEIVIAKREAEVGENIVKH